MRNTGLSCKWRIVAVTFDGVEKLVAAVASLSTRRVKTLLKLL
jgi:hypothetical protein